MLRRDPVWRWPLRFLHIAVLGLSCLRGVAAQPTSQPANLPNTQPALDEFLRLPAAEAYASAMRIWASGPQSRAEDLLAAWLRKNGPEPRVLFFSAACYRSRFYIKETIPLFEQVAKLSPDSPEGICAAWVAGMDRGTIPSQQGFAFLPRMLERYPDHPLIFWMAAVQCRTHNRNAEGARYYERVLELAPSGSLMVHWTYANLLDELNQHEKALQHRQPALRMEPAGWSYDGLGNTLTRLGRHEEARAAYEKCVELDDRFASYWHHYGNCLARLGRRRESIECYKRAVQIEPRNATYWALWGNELAVAGLHEDGLDKLKKAQQLAPEDPWAYECMASIYESRDENELALAMRERAASLRKRQERGQRP